jgi:hypothetical protein
MQSTLLPVWWATIYLRTVHFCYYVQLTCLHAADSSLVGSHGRP